MKEGTEVQRKVQIYFAFVYVVVPANAVSGVGQRADGPYCILPIGIYLGHLNWLKGGGTSKGWQNVEF